MSFAVKEWVKQWSARLVRYGVLSCSAASGRDELEGTLVDERDLSYQHPVRRFQHYGFRSRPKAGAEVICVSPGGGASNRVSVASEVPGTGPQNQTEGEVEMYSDAGQRVVLGKEGTVLIREASGGSVLFAEGVWAVDGAVSAGHFVGSGGAPHSIPGPGLGGGAATVLGSDAGMTVNLVVKMPSPGPLCTVVFAKKYPSTPHVGLGLQDSVTAKAALLSPFYVVANAASLQLWADGLIPGAYSVGIVVIG